MRQNTYSWISKHVIDDWNMTRLLSDTRHARLWPQRKQLNGRRIRIHHFQFFIFDFLLLVIEVVLVGVDFLFLIQYKTWSPSCNNESASMAFDCGNFLPVDKKRLGYSQLYSFQIFHLPV